MGVWIETAIRIDITNFAKSRPTRGVWIETLCYQNVINNLFLFSVWSI